MRRGAAVTIRDLFAAVRKRLKPTKDEVLKRLDDIPTPKPEPRPD